MTTSVSVSCPVVQLLLANPGVWGRIGIYTLDNGDRPMPATKKVTTALLLEPEQARTLTKLHERTRIPKQVLLREAVDDLFKKHRKILK